MSTRSFLRSERARVFEALRDLHHAILQRFNRKDIHNCGRHLGLLKQKTLIFDNEAELAVFSDYQVYSYRPRGFNAAEFYLRTNRERLGAFEQALLARMSAAQYSLLRVDSVEERDIVHATEMLTGTARVLADRALAESARPGLAIAAHLLVLDDYSKQTGGAVPIDANLLNDPQVERAMAPMMAGAVPLTDAAARAKMARAVISAAIRLGYTSRVAYAG
jgi:hypothetical protein